MTKLQKSKACREGYRESVEPILQSPVPTTADNIRVEFAKLELYIEKLSGLDDAIHDSLPEDDVKEDVKESNKLMERLIERQAQLKGKKMDLEKDEVNSELMSAKSHADTKVKLPKLEIAKYGGDPLLWRTFWETFDSSVHTNESLSDVDKFNYLRSLLVGPAASAVSAPILLSKFPVEIQYKVAEEHEDDLWDLERIREILLKIITAREKGPLNFRDLGITDYGNSSAVPKPTTVGALASTTKAVRCPFCDRSQFPTQCPLSVAERYGIARDHRLCFNCLRKVSADHTVATCRAKRQECLKCGKRHHTSLCNSNQSRTYHSQVQNSTYAKYDAGKSQPQHDNRGADKNYQSTTGNNLNPNSRVFVPQTAQKPTIQNDFTSQGFVLRQVAKVEAQCRQKSATVNVVFDTAGDRSLIRADVARLLSAKQAASETLKIVGCGKLTQGTSEYDVVEVSLLCRNRSWKKIKAVVLDEITCDLPKAVVSSAVSNFFKDFDLAIPFEGMSSSLQVDILVGLDHYCDFVKGPVVEMPGGPSAIYSEVGWLVYGACAADGPKSKVCTNLFIQCDKPGSLEKSVCRFWEVETMGVEPEKLPRESEKSLSVEQYERSVTHDQGRYFVDFLWKENAAQGLPDNRDMALARFHRLLEKLKHTPDLLQRYHEVIDQQVKSDFIEQVDESKAPDGVVHYIAHHHVVKEDRATTKIRVVYDASARVDIHSPSLNDCMNVGSDLMGNLFAILLRFRQFSVGVISDIEKAFLQVGLHQNQRDATRFFWCNKEDGSLKVYRFKRVPFGVICSPFLLNQTLQFHLSKYDSPSARSLSDNLYMDNAIVSIEKAEQAEAYYTTSKQILHDAGMNLREWRCNDADVMAKIPVGDQTKAKTLKVLGIAWQSEPDLMSISVSIPEQLSGVTTKRKVLAVLSSVFDPLGIAMPLVVRGKVFLQRLWKANLEWDEPITADLEKDWQTIVAELRQLVKFQFPRSLLLLSSRAYELHTFADASTSAYGAVVFLRDADERSYSRPKLICAKTKVAPIKQETIPRLELLAVLLASKLAGSVSSALTVKIAKSYVWSDSQIVLCWLETTKDLCQFVKTRVKEIHKAESQEFRYVASEDNPADLLSRGMKFDSYSTSKMWWQGPTWLSDTSDVWPAWKASAKQSQKCVQTQVVAQCPRETPFNIDHERYSSAVNLFRVTARCMQFVRALKGDPITEVRAEAIQEAENMWIKFIQEIHFNDEKMALHRNKRIKGIAQQLSLQLGKDGLLRCTTRLQNASVSQDVQTPVLLPYDDHLTYLIVEEVHKLNGHCGCRQTLTELRKQWWIPRGRKLVRKVLRKCVICRRWEGKAYSAPDAPPLPDFRVSVCPAFTYTGVDYAGPLMSKEGSKVWICLFTCASTRAVHLELAHNMSADGFLSCFRKFIARRGTPVKMISDNGANFKAADRVLAEVWRDVCQAKSVQDYVANRKIQWTFNVERAPWWGGFFERMVGLVKRTLKKVAGRAMLSIREIDAVLCEVEAIVNARPITYVYDDHGECAPLTPQDLMGFPRAIGIPAAPEDEDQFCQGIKVQTTENLTRRIRFYQRILDNYWSTWRSEYLQQLREYATKRAKGGLKVKVGDVVLLGDDVPRAQWKLGVVVEALPGKDGFVRAVKVRTERSVLGRPVQLLYPLEVSSQGEPTDLEPVIEDDPASTNVRPTRKAAVKAREAIRQVQDESGGEDV